MKSNFRTSIKFCDLRDATLTGVIRKIASVCVRRKTVLIALLLFISLVILLIKNHAKHKEGDSGYLNNPINHADNIFTG